MLYRVVKANVLRQLGNSSEADGDETLEIIPHEPISFMGWCKTRYIDGFANEHEILGSWGWCSNAETYVRGASYAVINEGGTVVDLTG